MKTVLKLHSIEYEYREVTVHNNQAAIERRKNWYKARGWELINTTFDVFGPYDCTLTFRRVKIGN